MIFRVQDLHQYRSTFQVLINLGELTQRVHEGFKYFLRLCGWYEIVGNVRLVRKTDFRQVELELSGRNLQPGYYEDDYHIVSPDVGPSHNRDLEIKFNLQPLGNQRFQLFLFSFSEALMDDDLREILDVYDVELNEELLSTWFQW